MYLFDAFGTFLKRIPIPVERILSYSKSLMMYLTQDSIGTYDLVKMEESRMARPEGAGAVVLSEQTIYYLDKEHRLTIVH